MRWFSLLGLISFLHVGLIQSSYGEPFGADAFWPTQFSSFSSQLNELRNDLKDDCEIDEQTWRNLVFTWGEIYAFQLGPIETPDYSTAIMLWPDPKGFVVRAIKNYRHDAGVEFSKQSIAIRGLTALDRIILNRLEQVRYCSLAQLIISGLIQKAEVIIPTTAPDYYADLAAYERAQHRAMSTTINLLTESLLPALESIQPPYGPFDTSGTSTVFLAGLISGVSSQYSIYWKEKLDELWPAVGTEIGGILNGLDQLSAVPAVLTPGQVKTVASQLNALQQVWFENVTKDQFVGFNAKDGD